MKKTYNVNLDNIPDEMKPYVKEKMSIDEVKILGNMLMRIKWESFKNRVKMRFKK